VYSFSRLVTLFIPFAEMSPAAGTATGLSSQATGRGRTMRGSAGVRPARDRRGGRPGGLTPTMWMMGTSLSGIQVERIITALPTIEGLTADPKVTAGAGPVAAQTIEIHPILANPSLPAQLFPVRASCRARESPPSRTCISTLYPSVTKHSDGNSMDAGAFLSWWAFRLVGWIRLWIRL